MNRDLRVYQYGNGSLRKFHPFQTKKFKTLEEANASIIYYLNSRMYDHQIVLVEYFGVYNSKIVKVYDKNNI